MTYPALLLEGAHPTGTGTLWRMETGMNLGTGGKVMIYKRKVVDLSQKDTSSG